MPHDYQSLISSNKAWAKKKKLQDSEYFNKLSLKQTPQFLYIGCSDSRMPLDTFTATEPGELFVHRNIANQVSLTDINFLSVLDYAVNVLKVKHIIVCGHYGCGGVSAAYDGKSSGLVANWISPIRDLSIEHEAELNAIESEELRLNRLSELNVLRQVENIYKTHVIQRALEKCHMDFQIHGWVLDLSTGHIIELEIPDSLKNK
ncbi:MAG: carbonic anhydrase [Bacteroidetes bacterium HGW-Bacteroidetes-1]|jgi:carbonic anhydrase|nr:MAG: carbonic anhydrase [Bacteroidetes bacterium HGW-Bacteroidetes-1]